MSTLQQQIVLKFLEKLANSKHIDALKIAQLRELLTGTKKFKAEDLVKIFSRPAVGEVK